MPDLSQFSTIYIGAPVWWGDWPMICYTFFENNSDGLAGKTLIPFSTHGGSGLAGFDNKLAAACPNSTVGAGLHIVWLIASIYGCTAFAGRNLADYMFRKTVFAFFDYSEPKAHFFMDYAAMMLLFMLAGYVVTIVTRCSQKLRKLIDG